MNSLQDLNNYSNTNVSYSDERPMSITFSNSSPSSQSLNISEGSTHNVPVSTNLTHVLSLSGNISYTVDVSSVPGAGVTWVFPLPNGVISNVISPGVYRLYNVNSPTIWNTIKSPTISMPRDFANNWSYTANISYPTISGPAYKSWQVNVTVTNLPEITVPTAFTYNEDQLTPVTGYPQILDNENTSGTYTVAISANNVSAIRNVTSTNNSSTASFDSGTKTYTIVGEKADVNNRLASLIVTPGYNFKNNFGLVYTLTNPNGLLTQVTQTALIGITHDSITNISGDRTYSKNQYSKLFPTNVPQIVENIDGAIYDLIFTLSSGSAGRLTNQDPTIDDTNWNNTTHSYTFSGSKSDCNLLFSTLKYLPSKNFTSNITINYTQTLLGTQTANVDIALNHSTAYDTNSITSVNKTVDENTYIPGNYAGFISDNRYISVYPYYTDTYSVIVEPYVNGVRSNTAILMNSTSLGTGPSSWQPIGNATSHYGIYQNFKYDYDTWSNPYTGSSGWQTWAISHLGNIALPQMTLYPDTTSTITLKTRLVINGSYDGNNVVGGDEIITNYSTVSIVPKTLCSLVSTSVEYPHLQNILLNTLVTFNADYPSHLYTITLTDTNSLGTFRFMGSNRGSSFSYTGSMAAIISEFAKSTNYYSSLSTGSTNITVSLTRIEPFEKSIFTGSIALTIGTPTVGASYGGGIYCATKNIGGYNYYLIADTFTGYGPFMRWATTSSSGSYPSTPTNTTTSDGASNTATLATKGIVAATLASTNRSGSGGQTDWYLPSIDELHAMCSAAPSVMNLTYWSSTITNGQIGYAGGNSNYTNSYPGTYGLGYVRAIRKVRI